MFYYIKRRYKFLCTHSVQVRIQLFISRIITTFRTSNLTELNKNTVESKSEVIRLKVKNLMIVEILIIRLLNFTISNISCTSILVSPSYTIFLNCKYLILSTWKVISRSMYRKKPVVKWAYYSYYSSELQSSDFEVSFVYVWGRIFSSSKFQ